MGHAIEVLKVFSKLGTTSFGGPIAHLAYFRAELVEKRRWLSEEQYASLLALCQSLPGPASSQLGFCLGYIRAGWLGALAAFLAFSLPSICLLICFALLTPHLNGSYGQTAIHGLKIVALAVVAHGVMGMAKKLCAKRVTASLAALAAAAVLLAPGAWMQVTVVLVAALVTALSGHERSDRPITIPATHSPGLGTLLIAIALLCLVGIPLLVALTGSEALAFIDAFYRSGALVFGGGHVVLPLLEESVVTRGWVSPEHRPLCPRVPSRRGITATLVKARCPPPGKSQPRWCQRRRRRNFRCCPV
jgi:chromate transporter